MGSFRVSSLTVLSQQNGMKCTTACYVCNVFLFCLNAMFVSVWNACVYVSKCNLISYRRAHTSTQHSSDLAFLLLLSLKISIHASSLDLYAERFKFYADADVDVASKLSHLFHDPKSYKMSLKSVNKQQRKHTMLGGGENVFTLQRHSASLCQQLMQHKDTLNSFLLLI